MMHDDAVSDRLAGVVVLGSAIVAAVGTFFSVQIVVDVARFSSWKMAKD